MHWVIVREQLNMIAWQGSASSISPGCYTALSCPRQSQRQHTLTRLLGQAPTCLPFSAMKWLNLLLFKDLATREHGDSRSASFSSPQSSPTFITQSMNLQMSLLAPPLPFGHKGLRANHHQVIKASVLCAAVSPSHFRHASESRLLHLHYSTLKSPVCCRRRPGSRLWAQICVIQIWLLSLSVTNQCLALFNLRNFHLKVAGSWHWQDCYGTESKQLHWQKIPK